MKYTQIRFILCLILAFSSLWGNAQIVAENEADSINDIKKPLVQVAFKKTDKNDILGGVSVVNVENLMKKNYMINSLEDMHAYIGGWNGASLWGMDGDNSGYLVLVDGVPREIADVVPTEIEQISFMKGAQAVVLYGSYGAKGVIYVTTKRGRTEGLKVDVRANTGFYVSKSYPEYLGSAEYMSLYNEAQVNDGQPKRYSDAEIYNYASNANPYRYPNVDFYSSEYLKKVYNRSDVTAEISGGGKRAHFYTNIGYLHQNDVFKFGEAEKNGVNRLNIRGNVDMQISNSISAYVNANAIFHDTKSANGDYWEAASTFRPNRISPLIPLSSIDPNAQTALDLIGGSSNIIGGQYFLTGTQLDQTNIFADYYAGGSRKATSRRFQFDTGINIDLDRVLKGLSFQPKFAVDYATSYTTSFDNKYAVYTPTWSNYNGKDVIVGLTKFNNDEKSGVQNVSESTDRQTIALSAQFNYANTFNEKHNVSAMLIASEFQKSLSGEYHKQSNANLGLQLGYNYLNKYYADFSAAYVYSTKLAEGHRTAFSPSVSLGWRLSNEAFLANSSVVDDLMLSVSGSQLHQDMDIEEFYMYKSVWNQAYGWSWYDGSLEKYTMSVRGNNSDLTFIKRKEFSVNLKSSLWNNLITTDASFFVNSTEGYVITPDILFPSYMETGYPDASFVPNMNYDNNKRVGFDFAVNLNKRLGNVDFTFGVAGTYYDTKATKRSEANQDAYQNREGKAMDGIWGLKNAGFFNSQEEIDNSPEQKFGGTLKPGDIKYIDQNNDNVIDEKDVVFLGKGGWYGNPFTLGINLTAKWNNFTFFVLGVGGFGASGLKNNSYYWVHGDGKYSAVVRDRWTEETKATAKYPRLTTESGSNNFRASDFWLYSTDRFDIAKLQITYDLPKSILHNTFLQEFSAYLSGANLLTIAKEREHMEMSIGEMPQARFYNVGIKAVF